MQHEFLQDTGLMFTESEMSELAEPQTSRPLISFAAAFPAKILATPEKAQDLTANDQDFGTNTRESFANYDPDTCLWRTFQLSLHEDLTPFLGRWPRSGTMQNGIAYRLPTLVRLTDVTDSSLLPTPQKFDANGITRTPEALARAKQLGGCSNLKDVLGGTPHPLFVEWMMGFPPNWSDSED